MSEPASVRPADAGHYQEVANTIDAGRRAVTASVRALGIYALMAPAEPWAAPEHELWLPALTR